MTERSDLDSLSPSDGALALRTFPRRYREAFDGDRRRRADEVGPEGSSAVDLVAATVRTLPALDRALEQTVTGDRPVLNASLFDTTTRTFDSPVGSIDDELDDLAEVAPPFADRVDRVASGDWRRTASLTGGGTVTALDVLREAVRTASDNLRAVQRLLSDD